MTSHQPNSAPVSVPVKSTPVAPTQVATQLVVISKKKAVGNHCTGVINPY